MLFYVFGDVSQGEYENYLNNVDYEEVIETLAMEGAEWEFSNGRYKAFKAKYLLRSPVCGNISSILYLYSPCIITLWIKRVLYYSSQ